MGIHHHEGGDLGGTNLSISPSLTRVGQAAKIASLHGHTAGALCTEGKYTWPQGTQSRMCKPLVRIDFVEPAAAEIVDHGSGHEGDAVPIPSAKPELLHAGGHSSDGLLAVGGAARKDDRIGECGPIAVAEAVSIDGPGRTATNIYRHRCAVLEVNDGEPRGAFLIAAHSNLDRRPVEVQGGPVDLRVRLENGHHNTEQSTPALKTNPETTTEIHNRYDIGPPPFLLRTAWARQDTNHRC